MRDEFDRLDERYKRIWSGLRDADPDDALARIAELAGEASGRTDLFMVGEILDLFMHDHLATMRVKLEMELRVNPGLRGTLRSVEQGPEILNE